MIQLKNVERSYKTGAGETWVLRRVTLDIQPGEFITAMGPSGAGKSTLLHLAGLLERPDGGEVRIAGQECGSLLDERRTQLRRVSLGFVYQFHHLLPEFSALETVMIPQMIAGVARGSAKTFNTASASVQERVNTDMQSSDRQAGTEPSLLTRPSVGFSPTMLLKPAGTRPEPAVSVPSEKLTNPAATATADPELEPPGMNDASNGFLGTP